ncbi:ABC-type lipoprotein release transport system permease subunit [Microbacterium sp. AK009]|uniref:FtsX-like permease family protein n=1 Tax=Microbacterium sp. AK009 TaxID=2723068 RepID=UPI0015CD57C1|nr:FtsX-like permease family protein [Microbacterium sp. AK009]NYF15264.1 ABC-type lipoprotein release transport system permease subunit [Microbacterium sp. AK009]
MADPRTLVTAGLVLRRARARAGHLAALAATVAVTVTTVILVLVVTGKAESLARADAAAGTPEDEVAAAVAVGAASLSSALPSLLLTVAVVAGVAVAQLGRLLAAAREHETDTARARGLSRRQAILLHTMEAVAVGVAGTIAGAAFAAGLASAIGGRDAASAALSQTAVAALVALLLAGILVAALARRSVTRRRGARATTISAVALVVAAAALGLWQIGFARPGGFDPVVALTPTVVLLAAALAVLAVFGAVARAAALPATRARGLETALGRRQLARRLPLSGVAVLLVALTVSQAVLAGAFAGTWAAAATDSAALRVGTDLRVDLTPQSASPADLGAAAAVDGIDAVAGAVTDVLEFGDDEVSLVALPAALAPQVMTAAGGAADPAALVRTVTGESDIGGIDVVRAAPVALGDAATGLAITVSARWTSADVSGALQPLAILVDARGTAVAQPLSLAPAPADDARVVAEAALPEGAAPWTLAALVMRVGPTPAVPAGTVTLEEVSTVGGDGLDLAGSVVFAGGDREEVIWLADGQERGAETAPAEALRVAVSDAFAARFGVTAGDRLDYRVAGTGRRGEVLVTAVVAAIPGASRADAVFAVTDDLLVASLQRGTSFALPGSVWAAGRSDSDAALSAALDDRAVRVAVPGVADRMVGVLVPGWWVAAGGAAVLALIATLAIVQSLALARGPEVAVLRALGVTARRQARLRAAELGAILGGAALLGAAAGAAVAFVLAAPLVRATTPGILPVALSLQPAWVPLVGVVTVLVAGLAATVVGAGLSVRRAARDAVVGEEAR